MADRAGAFDSLRIGIARVSRNDLFLVLTFGWVFASFLFLLGLPLISGGSTGDSGLMLYLGLLLVVIGAALPPAVRLREWLSSADSES